MILIAGASGKAGKTLIMAIFECIPAFLLSHACIVTDLTTSTGSVRRPIVTIDRRVRLSLSKWRGHRVGFCSWLMREVVFPVKTYRTLSS